MSDDGPVQRERAETDSDLGSSRIEPIEGSVVLTVEDFTAVWFKLPSTKRLVFSLAYLVFGVSLVPWVGVADFHPHKLFAVATTVSGIGLLALGLRNARNKWANNAITHQRGNEGVNYRFDEQGFELNFPVQRVNLGWDELFTGLETPGAFVLYTEPHFCFVVPKRAFDSKRTSELRALLADYVQPNKLEALLDWRRSALRIAVLLLAIWVIWQILSPK